MLGEGAPSPPAMEECRQEREGRRPSGEGAPSRLDMRERRGFSFFFNINTSNVRETLGG
jgi:hypothetical protein